MKRLLLLFFVGSLFFGCSDEPDPGTPGDESLLEKYPGLDPYHILHPIEYDEMLEILEGPEVSVIYFGWSTCPWCEQYVPHFDVAGRDAGWDRIFKFNVRETRQAVEDPDTGEYSLVPEFQAIVDILGPENLVTTNRPLGCEGDQCQELPWFTVPSLFVIRDGELLAAHIGAVPGHTREDGTLPPLTEDQRAELYQILDDLFAVALQAQPQ